jgi:hypothetical protein
VVGGIGKLLIFFSNKSPDPSPFLRSLVGVALLGGLVTYCNRKGGCTKRGQRQKNGFQETDEGAYSIDMAATKEMPFDHHRAMMMNGTATPPPPSPVPGYAENYHQPPEQEYHAGYPPVDPQQHDAAYYYQQPEQWNQQEWSQPEQWSHHPQQYGADSNSPYYQDPYPKPDAADHTYKPNAM